MEFITNFEIGIWMMNIAYALIIVFVGRILIRTLVKGVRKIMVRLNVDPILVNFGGNLTTTLLWVFVIVAVLDRLGVNTTSIIALLGATGLAIGLALRNSLQNLAAGLMLIVFRPFRQGDFIEAAGVQGIAEKIGIFSTQLRTPDNREMTVPNHRIYDGNITNFSARDTRRIDLVISISYEDNLRKAKAILEDLVEHHPMVLKDPLPVIRVAELADSSVNFDVRPWVNAVDFWAVRSELIEQIKLAFDDNGITIPFPQMTVHQRAEKHQSSPRK